MIDKIRVASSQYWIRPVAAWSGFAEQVESVVRTSADSGSKLVVFPEYFSVQLLSLGDMKRPIQTQIHDLSRFLTAYLELFSSLARKYKTYVVGGTIPTRIAAGKKGVINSSYLFAPSGKHSMQGKLNMTRFEAENWKISPEAKLKVFDTDIGKLAITVCYDVEFPELVRTAALAGAQIVIVPSCTDSRQGWLRVRYCAQARTVENQLYVIQSSTVGGLARVPSVHLNYGISSILTPSDWGFARDGILAEGTPNQETIVFGDLSLKALAQLRKDGSVLPFRDSPRAMRLARSVKIQSL